MYLLVLGSDFVVFVFLCSPVLLCDMLCKIFNLRVP